MRATFEVDRHHIEILSTFWTSLEVVLVDGKEVLRKRKLPFWLFDRLTFAAGEHQVELRYNALLMRSEAYVDGRLKVGCLFPQVLGYNALVISLIACLLALATFIAFA